MMGDNGQVSHWNAPVAAAPVDADVAIPGSKSLTNRSCSQPWPTAPPG